MFVGLEPLSLKITNLNTIYKDKTLMYQSIRFLSLKALGR